MLLALMFAVPSSATISIASSILKGYQGQMIPAVTTTIPISTTTSAVIPLNGFSLVGILLPAAFTGTALTFTVSVDGTNFFPLKSTTSGSTLTYTVGQGNYYAIDPVAFYGVEFLKIVSGSSEAAARILTLALKGI